MTIDFAGDGRSFIDWGETDGARYTVLGDSSSPDPSPDWRGPRILSARLLDMCVVDVGPGDVTEQFCDADGELLSTVSPFHPAKSHVSEIESLIP